MDFSCPFVAAKKGNAYFCSKVVFPVVCYPPEVVYCCEHLHDSSCILRLIRLGDNFQVTLLLFFYSSTTLFLGYLRGTWRNIRSSLISAANFYYIINKLIILVPDPH
jgi:hypothetical protein